MVDAMLGASSNIWNPMCFKHIIWYYHGWTEYYKKLEKKWWEKNEIYHGLKWKFEKKKEQLLTVPSYLMKFYYSSTLKW